MCDLIWETVEFDWGSVLAMWVQVPSRVLAWFESRTWVQVPVRDEWFEAAFGANCLAELGVSF